MKRIFYLIPLLILLFFASNSWAVSILPNPKFQVFDSSGAPLSGGKLYTYEPGTTTAKDTYSEISGTTANANPVVLDSRGEAEVYLRGSYKFVLKDSDGTTIWTLDNIYGYNDNIVRDDWLPSDDDTYDVGSGTSQFKDGYFDGTVYVDGLSLGGDVTIEADDNVSVGAYNKELKILYGKIAELNYLHLGTSGATAEEFSDDSSMSDSSTTAFVSENAIVSYVTSQVAGTGILQRSKFEFNYSSGVTVGPGVYYHIGTSGGQRLYWDSKLAFVFGPLGSNANSDALTANDWHYLYIDDSSVVAGATQVITASMLLNDTTEPTYNEKKHGWYNSEDMCLFAVRTNNSSGLSRFYHDGGDFVYYGEAASDAYEQDVDNVFEDVTLTNVGAEVYLYWRVNGESGTSGHCFGGYATNGIIAGSFADVYTGSSGIVEMLMTRPGVNQVDVWTNGFFLPHGM